MNRRILSLLLLFIPTASSFLRTTTTPPRGRFAFLLQSTTSSIPIEQRIWKENVPPVQVVDTMPEDLPSDLKNNYYLLRHGQSTANVDEIISSDRSTLAYTNKHGLTATGYQQGRASATQLLDLLQLADSSTRGDRVVFCSSPFARARETAQACLDGLFQDENNKQRWENDMGLEIVPDIYYHDLLMERSFGRLDAQAIYTYAYVWPLDRMNVTHTAFDVESVAAVCTRLYQLVQDLEQAFAKDNNDEDNNNNNKTTTHVVCVSHADVLQIAQLYAAQVPNVGDFSSYRFTNGEVRRMQVGTGLESLPPASPLEAPQRGTGM